MDVKTTASGLGTTLAQMLQGFGQPAQTAGERPAGGTPTRSAAAGSGIPSETRIAAAEQAGDQGEVRPRGSYVNFTV